MLTQGLTSTDFAAFILEAGNSTALLDPQTSGENIITKSFTLRRQPAGQKTQFIVRSLGPLAITKHTWREGYPVVLHLPQKQKPYGRI